MKILVMRDDIEVNTKDKTGCSPLSYATENQHEAVVKILVAGTTSRWTLDTKDSDGHSLLLHAVEEGHEAVVKLLVTRDDVKVDSKDKAGHLPLSSECMCSFSTPCPLYVSRPHLLALGTWSSKRGV